MNKHIGSKSVLNNSRNIAKYSSPIHQQNKLNSKLVLKHQYSQLPVGMHNGSSPFKRKQSTIYMDINDSYDYADYARNN